MLVASYEHGLYAVFNDIVFGNVISQGSMYNDIKQKLKYFILSYPHNAYIRSNLGYNRNDSLFYN